MIRDDRWISGNNSITSIKCLKNMNCTVNQWLNDMIIYQWNVCTTKLYGENEPNLSY